MRMREGDSIQGHIRQMTEVFNELSALVRGRSGDLFACKPV